jgi:dihydrodipicolinate synthase/N-acetylneuraminate lyase
MQGYETLMLPCIALGATGAISLSFSWMGPLYDQIIHEFHASNVDAARSLQEKVCIVIQTSDNA